MTDTGPNLLVPIDVRALVSGADAAEQTWADLTPRYGLIDAGVLLGDQLAPAPFTPRVTPPGPGVHLHWALPDALTRGQQTKDGTDFPLVPNRWLVVRLGLQPRAWVVLSDAISEGDPSGSTPWPVEKDGKYSSAYLGRVLDAGEWDGAEGDEMPFLTAVGPGDPLFAANYWSCRNVFSMHDALSDVVVGTEPLSLSYLVIGWWSATAADPLHGSADWRARLHELGWSVSAEAVEPPAGTLLHGLVTDVPWGGPRAAVPAGVPQGPVQVGIGNSTTEGLAALLAAHLPDRAGAERLLQAFLDGLMPQLEGPDGLMVLEELEHQGEFAPADGGTSWDIVPHPSSLEQTAPQSEALTPYGAALADPLDALNAAQGNLEAARWELASLRRMLYSTWHRKVQLEQAAWPGTPTAAAVTQYITETLIPRVEKAEGDVSRLDGSFTVALEQARAAVEADKQHELRELPRPRFWQSRPPVAVLSGPGVKRSYRHGHDGRFEADGTLRCRISGMPLAGPRVELPLPRRLGTDGAALVSEAVTLMDPDAPRIGTPPSPAGVVSWSPPWTPLTLQWEAQWQPTDAAPSAALDGWALGEIDFRWEGGDPFRAPARRFTGQAPLDPATTVRLAAQVKRYVADHPDDPYAAKLTALASRVGTLDVVSQALSGFVWSLLGTVQTLQMPVVDLRDPALGEAVAAHVGPGDEITPDPSGDFEPLRAGNLLVTRLAIVDTFGQVKPLGIEAGAPPPLVAESMRSAAAPRHAELPPRITQPARLRFEWQPAADDASEREATSDAATTPIAGWILPNHIDASLMVYDPIGTLLGELQLIEGALDPGGPGVRWLPAVGTPQTLGAPPLLPNQTLRGFLAGLMSAGQDGHHALRDLLATIDETLPTVDALASWKDQSLAILVGRPLALARARLWIDLQGLPAFAQTWDGLRWQMEHDTLPTEGFTGVELPVVLGDTRRLADGLMGFFAGGDYAHFRLARHGAEPPKRSSYVVPGAPVHVVADPAVSPVEVTLVLDPRAAVHATCAMLPAESLSVAAPYSAAAQAAMEVTFLTGPIVSDPARVSLPVPGTPGTWTWLSLAQSGAWQEADKIAPVDVQASLDPSPQAILDGWLKLSDALKGGVSR
jgi:hypothetical protein